MPPSLNPPPQYIPRKTFINFHKFIQHLYSLSTLIRTPPYLLSKQSQPTTMRLDVIVCIDKDSAIGSSKSNSIPWHLPEDLKHFKEITTKETKPKTQNAVIMGRKTWESIPAKYRPLPGRVNIVISRTLKAPKPKEDDSTEQTTYFVTSYEAAITLVHQTLLNVENAFIIGGASLYAKTLDDPRLRYVYVTHYEESHKPEADIFFPTDKLSTLELADAKRSETNPKLTFCKYTNPNREEKCFQDLLTQILTKGIKNPDRTGVGTLSIFGHQLRYDLTRSFPLMTSRKAFMRQILEEFKFIMSGSTDVTKLQAQKVHIWDGNTTREFLDSRGLEHLPEFDMGPTYGFALRHYGAKYVTCKTDYTNQGFDQLQYVVDTIHKDPTSRRIRISIWDPAHLHDVALTPCLNQFDFYVDTERKTLNLLAFLRSSDTFLALMWNTTYCAIFCHVVAKLTNLTPGELIMNTANSHLYLNHLEQAKLQASREPHPFPSAYLSRALRTIEDIQELKVSDFNIRSYTAHAPIKADMAV